MPRRVVDLPTTIYWLVDTSNGEAFYCGKSIYPGERFSYHKYTARRGDKTATAKRIAACPADALKMHVVQVVPADGDWREAERRWIRQLRIINPHGCTNRADGGSGVPGYVWSDEQRAFWSMAQKGRVFSKRHLENLRNGARKRWQKQGISDETRAKMSATRKGKPKSPEMRAKLSATMQKKWAKRIVPTEKEQVVRRTEGEILNAQIESRMAQLAGMPLHLIRPKRLAALRQQACRELFGDKKAA